MPDKEREELFIGLFLKDYNSRTGKDYAVVGRPEEEAGPTGTYDFLCQDTNSTGDYLAVEEKSLNKSTESVRDNKEIREIVTEVNRILEKKELFYSNEYFFHLEFKNAPSSRERQKYAGKIAEVVQRMIDEGSGVDCRGQVVVKIEGCDCIKKFCLFSIAKSRKVIFGYAPEGNFSRDVQRDTFDAIARILENSDSKLKIPKEEKKKTILLITSDWNNFILADQHNVTHAIGSFDEQSHEHIDEIFFMSKRDFEDGYNVNKVK
jgi:hypothetical protein